jgi:hypothetical protein
MVTEIVLAALPWAVPAVAAGAGGIMAGVQLNTRRKREYQATRARLSAELITMDEHIGFAEAAADPKRARDVLQARLALNAAFHAHSRYFGSDSHKGVPLRQATFEVDQHLNNSRMYLAGPKVNSNQELIDAAKAVGRQVAALAKIGAGRLLAQGSQELTRISNSYQDPNQR